MIQPKVQAISLLGPLPSSMNLDASKLIEIEKLLTEVQQPISNDDALVLCKQFGPDDCFGLAWTLIHLIETAPGWPFNGCFENSDNEWINILKQRCVDLQ